MVDQELYEVEKKRLRIKELARKMEKKRKVGIKELAAFAGLVIACWPALGRMARFRTRFAVIQVQEEVDNNGWYGRLEINAMVKEELEFWIERVDSLNG